MVCLYGARSGIFVRLPSQMQVADGRYARGVWLRIALHVGQLILESQFSRWLNPSSEAYSTLVRVLPGAARFSLGCSWFQAVAWDGTRLEFGINAPGCCLRSRR